MPSLILVDGFAGTGKSTVAQRLWLDLTRAGRPARWFHEHERSHPIFQYGEVEELLRQTPDEFERGIIAAWDAVTSAGGSTVRIIEGALLQIPVGVMIAMGAPAARIRAMLRQIAGRLARADAVLIYLFHADLSRSLQRTGHLRGPQWLPEMIAAVGASPYGQRHRVRDLRGLTTFYERQRRIVEATLRGLPVKHVAVDVTSARWDRHQRDIARAAGVSRRAEPALTAAALLGYAGVYRSPTGLPGVMATDGRRLYAQLPATRPLPLVPVGDVAGHFCAESLPIDFHFGSAARPRRFRYDSRMANEVLRDTTWGRA